jgi:tetrapyrrole methylase family protein/MazG family protein
VDSESALRATNQKFRRRFKHIEKSARTLGRDLQSMTLDEMDAYWNEAKGFE